MPRVPNAATLRATDASRRSRLNDSSSNPRTDSEQDLNARRVSSSSNSSRSHHHPVLEPPFEQFERSSSPRRHSTSNSARPKRRTVLDLSSSPSSDSHSTHAGGAAASAAASSASAHTTTPQRYASPPSRAWPEDEVSLPSLRDSDRFPTDLLGWSPGDLSRLASSDDHFLSDLVNQNLSSPSTYPSFTQQAQPSAPPGRRLRQPHQSTEASRATHQARTQPVETPRTGTVTCPLHGTSRSQTNVSASTSFNSERSYYSAATRGDTAQETSQSSVDLDENMSPATRRQSLSDGVLEVDAAPASKRRRISTAGRPSSTVLGSSRRHKAEDDDPFEDGEKPSTAGKEDEPYMIDLTEGNDLPQDLQKPAAEPEKEDDQRIKLRAFQCVICFDDSTTLTVTHCGHLYCAQCLHSALHVETTKGRCPMCRSKIEMKSRDAYTSKTKGFYPLEIKLMTKTRAGKRKAGAMS